MDIKINKVTLSKSGKGNITAKISIPLQWLQDLGVDDEKREVKLVKDGEKIIILPVNRGEKWE